MLMANPHTRDRTLASLGQKIALDFIAIVTLVKLDYHRLDVGILGSEEILGTLAVRTPRLGEDDNIVFGDGFLNKVLGGHL